METTLIFAGIPALVIVIIVGAVYAGGSGRSKRYRPGRPFEFTPVWFLSAPEEMAEAAKAREAHELTGSNRPALTSGSTSSTALGDWPGEAQAREHATGGASDRW
jgi:hypothetical protein